jgi:hypothetical protein
MQDPGECIQYYFYCSEHGKYHHSTISQYFEDCGLENCRWKYVEEVGEVRNAMETTWDEIGDFQICS